MIGVGVRFEQPVDRQALRLDIGDHRVGRLVRRAPGGRIIVQNRVDHRRAARRAIMYDIGNRVRRIVEKGLDFERLRLCCLDLGASLFDNLVHHLPIL